MCAPATVPDGHVAYLIVVCIDVSEAAAAKCARNHDDRACFPGVLTVIAAVCDTVCVEGARIYSRAAGVVIQAMAALVIVVMPVQY